MVSEKTTPLRERMIEDMRVFKVIIRPDADAPDTRQGWARAETERAALALINHPDAIAFPKSCLWPGHPQASVHWSN